MKPANLIAELATRSILLEVSTHPKPGLVTPISCGSHDDMDYTSFILSSSVLSQGFGEVTSFGYGYEGNLDSMLAPIRALGVETEKRMFEVTDGVNTQKGLIFLFFMLLGSTSYLFKRKRISSSKDVTEGAAMITKGIVERELCPLKESLPEKKLSKGEMLFIHHGVTGIRGEVEKGLMSVHQYGLPALREALSKGCSINDASINSLLALIGHVEDTNIMARKGIEMHSDMQNKARRVYDEGGMTTDKGREKMVDLNESFIRHNISPGGAADLLSATLFLHFIDTEIVSRYAVPHY